MLTFQTVYVTNYDTETLTDKQVREFEALAVTAQTMAWGLWEDELIGVPEVEVWNNVVHQVFEDKHKREHGWC